MSALRIVFFGLPLAALLLARDGHEIPLVCLCREDAVGVRRAKRIFGPENVLMMPNAHSPALLKRVRSLGADLLVSWFWTKRLPMNVVHAARLGGIGVHPSLLPRHRGPDPTFWAIDAGDLETGVSVHRIEAEYDTGDVLAQQTLAIDPSWNAWQLARALDRPSLSLLRKTVMQYARGEIPKAFAQDPALATQAPFPSDDDCILRFSWPLEQLLRRIRALSPAPGASTEMGDRVLTILRAEPWDRGHLPIEPGEMLVSPDGSVVIGAKDGALRILACEVDGEPTSTGDLSRLVQREALLCSPGPRDDE